MEVAHDLINRARQIARTGKDPADSTNEASPYAVAPTPAASAARAQPPIVVVPPPVPVAAAPPDWMDFRILTAEDVIKIIQRACDAPGSITTSELNNTRWMCDSNLDYLRPETGTGLSGCSMALWNILKQDRLICETEKKSMLVLNAEGINSSAQRLAAAHALPVNDPVNRQRKNEPHTVDLSRAKEIVRRLQSPF